MKKLLYIIFGVMGALMFIQCSDWTEMEPKFTEPVNINGEDYYAASSGTIQAQWVKSGRNWYYVDTDGKMVTGDYIIDRKVNYFDNQGLWMNKIN